MSADKGRPDEEARAASIRSASSGLRRISVSELLAGDREVVLEHEGQDYRLRITAKGKLILTK